MFCRKCSFKTYKERKCLLLPAAVSNLKWEDISNLYLNNTFFPKRSYLGTKCVVHTACAAPLSLSVVQKTAVWRLRLLYGHARLTCSNLPIAGCLVCVLVYFSFCCVLVFYCCMTSDHKRSGSKQSTSSAWLWWLSWASAWDLSRWDQGRLSPGAPGREWKNPVPCGRRTQGPFSLLVVGWVLLSDPKGRPHLHGLLRLQLSTVQRNLFTFQIPLPFFSVTGQRNFLAFKGFYEVQCAR